MEFLPLAAIALVFWLFIVRPASRRQKEVARLQAALAPGNRVLLSSGIYAVVQEAFDDRIRAEIAPGVVVDVARGAVAAIEPAPGQDDQDRPDGQSRPDELGGPAAPGA